MSKCPSDKEVIEAQAAEIIALESTVNELKSALALSFIGCLTAEADLAEVERLLITACLANDCGQLPKDKDNWPQGFHAKAEELEKLAIALAGDCTLKDAADLLLDFKPDDVTVH